MARIPYISRKELTPGDQKIYDHIAESRSNVDKKEEIPRVYQLLLNSPKAASALGKLGEYLRFESSLDPVIREIAILSVARQLGSRYEWAHHEPIAKQVGVRDQVIESIRSGRAPMGIPAKEGVFAQAAKEFANEGSLTERTFQAILHLLGPQHTVDLIVLVGYYVMLANTMETLGVDLDDNLDHDII